MTLLLTGASGFIGKNFLKTAQKLSLDVRPVYRAIGCTSGQTDQFIVTELDDASDWSQALQGVDVVVHMSARAHVMNEQLTDPLTEYRRVNVQGTSNLAWQAAQAGVKRFVFLSSVKVNGEATQLGQPLTPIDAPAPQDDYGLSKHEAEQVLWQVARDTGMEVVVIRPPLVYGPGVKGNFKRMVQWVRLGVPLPLGAVHNRRSLVAVDNLVDFIALCASPERSPQAANQTFCVSDGDDVSTTELLCRVAHAYGVPALLLPVPVCLLRGAARLLGKTALADRLLGSLQVDTSNAHNLLGWTPPTTMQAQLSKMALLEGQTGA